MWREAVKIVGQVAESALLIVGIRIGTAVPAPQRDRDPGQRLS
jgi:hypothetical protein